MDSLEIHHPDRPHHHPRGRSCDPCSSRSPRHSSGPFGCLRCAGDEKYGSFQRLFVLHSAAALLITLRLELGFVAGRLYFEPDEYPSLMQYIQKAPESGSLQAEAVPLKRRNLLEGRFTRKPVKFLLEWLALRRKSQYILYTPMGYVCQNKELRADHPFFIKQQEVFCTGKVSETEAADMNAKMRADSDIDTDVDEYFPLEQNWTMTATLVRMQMRKRLRLLVWRACTKGLMHEVLHLVSGKYATSGNA
jgi:hypothetical protein